MSTLTRTEQLDDLYTSTFNNRKAEVTDQIFQKVPLLDKLKSSGGIQFDGTGGRYLEVNLSYEKNQTISSIGRGDTVSINDTKFLTVAQFEWKFAAGSIIRYYVDDAKNKSKSQVMSLANSKIDNLKNSLSDDLERQLNADGTGNGSLDTEGLQNLVDSTPTVARTVGNIAQATYPWWQNKQKTSTGAASIYLRSDLRNLTHTCSLGSKSGVPNLYYTDQTTFEICEDEMEEQRYIFDTSRGIEMVNTDPVFMGKPIIWSPQAPSGNIYVLNTEYMGLVLDPDINFVMTEWKTIPNQLDRVAQIVVKLNFVTFRRASQGVLTAVAV